jgi:hypothetical protein
VESNGTALDGRRPEQVATALLGAVAECHGALYDYASEVWDRHDFGNGSSLGPHLTIELGFPTR